MRWHTNFSIEECKSQLASAIGAERLAIGWSRHAGNKDVLGQIRELTFQLRVRRFYRNSFAPVFYGQFVAAEDGTLIDGKFKMHPFVRVFMIAWFCFLAVFAIIALIIPTHGQAGVIPVKVVMIFAPALMAVFGICLIKFGQSLGQDEEQFIVSFLKSALVAKDA